MIAHGHRHLVASWLCALATLVLAARPAQADDPLVAYFASQVSQDHVTSTIQTLEGFGTRYSYAPECEAAADWLYATLASYGVAVSVEEFAYGGDTMRNVIGRIQGTLDPDGVFIVGAHYDSTSSLPWTDAPGADDNASGVAAVLEAARVLAGHEFAHSIEFILFAGEEQGRRGSIYNANRASIAGKNILGMVNLDMIGYWPASSDMELDIGKNAASSWLALVAESAALTYASIPVHNWPDTGVCHDDQVSYWARGYDAIVLMDCYEAHKDPAGSGESTPHYHQTSDTISTLNLAHTTEAARATVATVAVLAEPILAELVLNVAKDPAANDVLLLWLGGVPTYMAECSTSKDFSAGVVELTPPGGTTATAWSHPAALDDGVDYYYLISGSE